MAGVGGQLITAEEIAAEAANGGAQELKEFTDKTFNDYLKRFLAHKANLEKLKIDFTTAADTHRNNTQSLSVLSQLTNIITTYPSGKKGGDVLPLEELEQGQKEIQNKVQQLYADKKTQTFKWANKAYEVQDLTRISLTIMRDVYNLKEAITGITEKFALMYRGGRNIMSVVEVNVSTFFSTVLNNNDIFNVTQGDDFNNWGLRFNDKTMRKMLIANKFGVGTNIDKLNVGQNILLNDTKDISQFYRNQRDKLTIVSKSFKELNKTELRWAGYDPETLNFVGGGKQGKFSKGITGMILRVDSTYLIVEKEFASGFIAQSIFNAYKNNQVYNYETDKLDWYLGGDVSTIDANGNKIEYSVKSFLEGAPSLVSINSLFTVVNKILAVLISQKNQDITTITQTLKSYVFKAAEPIAEASRQEIDNLLTILSG